MLKITRSFEKLALIVFRANDNKVVDNNNRANKTIMNLFKNNKPRNLACMPNIKAIKKLTFLIFNAKKVFNYLK